MLKFKQVMSVIERRIQSGDYNLHSIPGERKIAEEIGVSHMTARKAVRGLLDRKVLIRRVNGALDINPEYEAGSPTEQLILLCPAYASAFLTNLCQVVTTCAGRHGFNIRPVQYVHWDDPAVISAVSKPGGTLVIPTSDDVPAHILASLRANKGVSLDLDLSDRGVPSIRLFPDTAISGVFSHLKSLGHARIDCLSTHTHNPEINRRIELWREWRARHGVAGELHENAAPSFSDPTPFAHEAMHRILKMNTPTSAAFVCTTFPAAVGAARACWERGLTVGKDVSICAVNIESPARFMTPAITGLDTPDLFSVLAQCFDWFRTGGEWVGPLCLEPVQADFFVGESTSPADIAINS